MERIIKYYHDLHQIPELGFHEYKTKEYIKSVLSPLHGVIYEVGNCGLIFYLDLKKEKTIGFRCELDGLPILEQTTHSFKSTHQGFMHACGHDIHMAIILSLIESMSKETSLYNGVFIFQSGEELSGGAWEMVNSGLIQKYSPIAIFGMHVWPSLPFGRLYSRENTILAGSEEVDIEIYGVSQHISSINNRDDALLCCSDILLTLNKILPKSKEVRCRFGLMESGTARNVTASYACVKGSIRYFDSKDKNLCLEILEDVVKRKESSWGTSSQIVLKSCNLPINNNEYLYELIKCYVSLSKCPTYFQSEDFGAYATICPILFLLLGCGEDVYPLHSSSFWVEDELVILGVNYYKEIIRAPFQ